MSHIPLSHPSQAAMREHIAKDLITRGWFLSRDNIVQFIKALKLGTRLSTSLVEPANHLFDLSQLDYGTMLKIALAHWMRKAKNMATLINLSDILRSAGFGEAERALGKLQGIGGVVRTPQNGVELQECCDNCQPGDTIILKSNTEYHGTFRIEKNQVTLRGGVGSNIISKEGPRDWGILVTGNDCTVDNVRCTGSAQGMRVHGSRCTLSGLHLNGLTVLGNDNNVHNVVISGAPLASSMHVGGESNSFASVRTQHGLRGIRVKGSAAKYSFENCTFDGASISTIRGRNGKFMDVNFSHGVTVDAEDILLERCSGILLKLPKKESVQQKACNFSKVRTKKP